MINKYYPLELEDSFIYLYSKDGRSRQAIAAFIFETINTFHLKFINDRPVNDRVDPTVFFELVKIGYEELNNEILE